MKEMGTIELLTDRLILRKFKDEDALDMYNNWASDELTSRYVTWNTHKDVNETKEVIRNWIDEYDVGGYNWIVELKDTHQPIGSITAVHIHRKDLNVEVGYCYGSSFWGKGYATEALRKVIEYLINDCGFYLVEAKHLSENPASGRVMEKAGMHKEAVLRKRMINKVTNELDDIVVYSVTKDELK